MAHPVCASRAPRRASTASSAARPARPHDRGSGVGGLWPARKARDRRDHEGKGSRPNLEKTVLASGTWVHGNDRQGLERLARYGARGPVAESRLRRLDDGRYEYTPKGDGLPLVLTAEALTAEALMKRCHRIHPLRHPEAHLPVADHRARSAAQLHLQVGPRQVPRLLQPCGRANCADSDVGGLAPHF
jgi:hypothetical protein